MKKIEFFPSIYPLHGAYRSLLTSPPEGYSFSQPNINFGVFSRLKSYKIIKTIYKKITQLLRINFSQKIIDLQKSQKNSDLIFSTGVLYKGNSPWVLDLLDVPQSLTGYNYNLFVNSTKKITHFLLRDNCKAIICANKTCWDIMENNFSKRVIDKMVLIHPGLNLPKDTFDKKSKNPKDIQFLFMGSLTNPDDFLIKGGLESLEVFKGLSLKYPNIQLIVKCRVPEEIKKKYNLPNIKYIEEIIPYEQVLDIYKTSDISLLPGHTYFLMAFLEAMSFGKPLIALDTYSAKDYVENGKNGFLIKPSDKIPYNAPEYPLNVRSKEFIKSIKRIDQEVINKIAKAIEILIEDPKLREKMSKKNREIIKKDFTIEKRNKELKKLFDKIV